MSPFTHYRVTLHGVKKCKNRLIFVFYKRNFMSLGKMAFSHRVEPKLGQASETNGLYETFTLHLNKLRGGDLLIPFFWSQLLVPIPLDRSG